MIWFRKYNKTVMAFVVIALMIVFTIEPLMNYFSSSRTGVKRVIAYYDDGKKINRQDVEIANQQLEVLKTLGIEALLRPNDPRISSNEDLRVILLGEVIFPERASEIESISRIKQLVSMNNYGISDKQINEIYTKQFPASMYWILLTREAREAGIRMPEDDIKRQLVALVPKMQRGATYEQVIDYLERRNHISEYQVIEAFGNLTSVIEYCRAICDTQNRTIQQVLNQTNLRLEGIDVNYVVIDAETFVDKSLNPGADKVSEQFEKYKGVLAGEVSEGNPYGFGYKLPDRVGLEYIAIRLDDVASTVKPLTPQETEDYYQQHLQMFTRMVPSDPNDPNSEAAPKTRSYAEVAAVISRQLYQQRVDSKAERILGEAKSITEANLAGSESEQSKLTDEQFKKSAVDYDKVAAELSEKYQVKVYSGKTGLLSATDIQSDQNFAPLYAGGSGVTESSFVRVVFAVDQLKAVELGPMDVKTPRLYENIGPFKDAREMTGGGMGGYAGKNMMLVRIVAAEKAAELKSIDEKIDKRSVNLDGVQSAGKDVNTVRELVVEDLRRVAAMSKAQTRAQEFVAMAAKDGWKDVVDKFNKLYGKSKDDVNAPSGKERTFNFSKRTGLRRMNSFDLSEIRTRYEGNPMGNYYVNRVSREGALINKLYALIPADGNSLDKPGTILEYKPFTNYYCIESMTIHRPYQEQFDMAKASETVNDEFAESQSLAVIYYTPKNIVKRMKFVEVKEVQEATPSGAEPNAAGADSNRTGK